MNASYDDELTSLQIAIVTHNSNSVLAGCLQSIESSKIGFEMRPVIVDSGGSEDPEDVAAGSEVIRLPNVGYGSAINEALRHAKSSYSLVMNPDVRISGNDIARLLAVATDRPDIAVLVPSLSNDHGEAVPHYASYSTPPWRKRVKIWEQEYDKGTGEVLRYCAAAQGSVMMLNVAAVRRVGGFDPNFFLYFEEVDLAIRLRRAGFKVVEVPGANALHIGEASSSGVDGAWRAAQRSRGKFYFLRKHYSLFEAVLSGLIDAGRELRRGRYRAWLAVAVVDPRMGLATPKALRSTD